MIHTLESFVLLISATVYYSSKHRVPLFYQFVSLVFSTTNVFILCAGFTEYL